MQVKKAKYILLFNVFVLSTLVSRTLVAVHYIIDVGKTIEKKPVVQSKENLTGKYQDITKALLFLYLKVP